MFSPDMFEEHETPVPMRAVVTLRSGTITEPDGSVIELENHITLECDSTYDEEAVIDDLRDQGVDIKDEDILWITFSRLKRSFTEEDDYEEFLENSKPDFSSYDRMEPDFSDEGDD